MDICWAPILFSMTKKNINSSNYNPRFHFLRAFLFKRYDHIMMAWVLSGIDQFCAITCILCSSDII